MQHLIPFDHGPATVAQIEAQTKQVRRELEQPPSQSHSPTSLSAAQKIKPQAATGERQLHQWALTRGDHGFTDLEAQEHFGWSGDYQRPRRRTLELSGLVRKTDRTRPTPSGREAAVWVVEETSSQP